MTQSETPAPIPVPVAPEASDVNPKLKSYLQAMAKFDASDLLLKVSRPPVVRQRSVLQQLKEPALTPEVMQLFTDSLLNADQQAIFKIKGTVDLAWEIPGGDRFRINIFRQRGNISLVARRVTRDIPNFEDLHLPKAIEEITQDHQGLILLAGPTGCGKSTTIASMLEHINTTRRCHIITIEDPIEYLYEDKLAMINQREIGIDVPDFNTALRSMLREDPDIILIGEMRDPETFEAALQASETGHLVFGTVHASSAPQTISRILDLFPPESRENVRQSMAFNLKAVICQRLLPSVKEGLFRVPAVEIMRSTPTVRQLLEENRTAELADVVKTRDSNMQDLNQSLHDLISSELIDPKVAYAASGNPDELKMLIKGISQSTAGLIGRR